MGMSDFKDVLADFKELGSLSLKGVAVAPWIDLWLKMGPPPAKWIAPLTSLFQFVVVMWGFNFWSKLKREELNRRMKIALSMFCLGLITSILLIGVFTISPGNGRERVIKGWVIRNEIQPLFNSSYIPEQALREGEYDPNMIWTTASIETIRIVITVVWLATFASLAGYLTAFIVLHRRYPTRRLPSADQAHKA